MELSILTSIKDYEHGEPLRCPICLRDMSEIAEEVYECQLCGETLDPLTYKTNK